MIKAGPIGTRQTGYGYCDDVKVYEDVDDDEWDGKGRTVISHIYVSFDDELVRSVQFCYLENGAPVLSTQYGSSEGCSFHVVRLNQDEYVTGLSGKLKRPRSGAIRSLTFHTNRGMHGPFGSSNEGYKMEIVPGISDRREFGGFFGSYGINSLSSIGIYVSPIASSESSDMVVVKRENM